MPSYLLVIGDREALGWILSAERMAFPTASRREVAALDVGDHLFLYTTRGAYKNPTRDRGRVIGAATVRTQVERLAEPVRFGDREFPVGCELSFGPLAPWGAGVELHSLVPRLESFLGVEAAWSTRLRRPLVHLPERDAELLWKELTPHVSTSTDLDPYTRWYRARTKTTA
ncbi:hypothetical protein AAG589_00720 [Isoptericola sp. F-RaC21]|uniref:hypothetical protein n=1 Tax=Isoptericola sp. F-RaC21 TaxID=3141452 RepID=UPI00315B7E4A